LAGLYIHIPFCKRKCNYCNFYSIASRKKAVGFTPLLIRELELRKDFLKDQVIDTIYFGGGTPSVLTTTEIQFLIDAVYENFSVAALPEITLEANPDDLSKERIIELSKSPINRLSIGIQSFDDHVLEFLNRAHSKQSAIKSIEGFDIIVGNPPYVSAAKIDKESRKFLENWSVSSSGKSDLYIPFF